MTQIQISNDLIHLTPAPLLKERGIWSLEFGNFEFV
jgi:hypothetical protein